MKDMVLQGVEDRQKGWPPIVKLSEEPSPWGGN